MRTLLVSLVIGALGLSALGAANYTLLIAYNDSLGSYLTDGDGRTLYIFANDVAGESTCSGGCLANWPIFYTAQVVAPPGVNPADFGTIRRPDGRLQTTYRGWPLYYFAGDNAPGDVNGDGVKQVWFVVKIPFYTVLVGNKPDTGPYLVDAQGKALYYFTNDQPGTTNCSGDCLDKWPAFDAGTLVLPSGLNPVDFSFIVRPEGKLQTTYKGYPLYYFFQDTARGETRGQGVKGVWFLVNPWAFAP